MTFNTAVLIKKYFFTLKHLPNLVEIDKLSLSKPEKRDLLVTLRVGFVLYETIKQRWPKITKKKSCELSCALLMLAMQALLIHEQPLYHISSSLKKLFNDVKQSWMLNPSIAFLKKLSSWKQVLFDFELSQKEGSLIFHLKKEHFSLDINHFFSHPPLWVRLDNSDSLKKIDPDLILKTIQGSVNALLLKSITPEIVTLFEQGILSYQDIAAQSLYEVLDFLHQEPTFIIDCCAAPGGKSTGLIKRYKNASFLLTDVDAIRLNGLINNINRTGHGKNPEILIQKHDWENNSFPIKSDLILVDAPCSGVGVIRRHPDILWNKTYQDLFTYAESQKKILAHAIQSLNQGGYLIYATCSLSSIENDEVIKSFLEKNNDIKIQHFSLSLGTATKYGVQILPTENHDGLYYSLLKKY
jgi:16S rRNA C967 or C1407 C5-methylase (RsmB/RsmF family)